MTNIIAHTALLAAVEKRRLLPSIAAQALAQRLAQAAPADPSGLATWLSRQPELPGISAAVLAELLPGPEAVAAFPGYRPLAHLATGGMGMIWLAASARNELVVIKTLTPELRPPAQPAPAVGDEIWLGEVTEERPSDRPDGDPQQRLERETKITRSLDHPHIVRCLTSGVSPEGGQFLVLEYMAGGDLKDLLDTYGALPEALALSLAGQITAALIVAGAAELIHRDLKPANIFLTADGRAKLADFGFARSHRANRTLLTMAGSTLGSPLYMAPEQIAGATTLDARCDLYGLGCVLHHCLAGSPPFNGTLTQVLRAHCVAPAPDLRAARPTLHPATVALVARLLAKDPAARFPDAAAAAAAIRGAQVALGLDPAALVTLPHRPQPSGTGDTTIDLPAPGLAEPQLTLRRGGEVIVCCWHQPRLILGKLRGPGVDGCLRTYPEAAHRLTDNRLSRAHLAFSLDAASATVCDLRSANGTTCDGMPLVAQQAQLLAPGVSHTLALAQTLALVARAHPARPHPGLASGGTIDAVTITRPDNRPTLAYALVGRALTIGGPDTDLPLPGATRRATIAWSNGGWCVRLADGAWQAVSPTTSWDLGGDAVQAAAGTRDDL